MNYLFIYYDQERDEEEAVDTGKRCVDMEGHQLAFSGYIHIDVSDFNE